MASKFHFKDMTDFNLTAHGNLSGAEKFYGWCEDHQTLKLNSTSNFSAIR